MHSEYILEMKHIRKDFYGNQVLKDVSLQVKPGEIVALIGENGAGKSTIMNILFGMPAIQQTGGFSGQIFVDGEEVQIKNPTEAMKYGIGMVHQEFMLIDGFDVAENIKLNRENVRKSPLSFLVGKSMDLIDRPAMHREAGETLKSLSIGLNENSRVGSLPVGYKQFVEISRELDKKNIKLIVLDEPTAVLTETEAKQFTDCVQNVAKRGISFIFISHKLDEIKNITDHVFILRDGEKVGDYPTSELNTVEMSRLMIGRAVSIFKREQSESEEENHQIGMEVNHLAVKMPGEFTQDISFTVYKNEIFGIGGLAGHGKISIANGIMGMYPAHGTVTMNGKEIDCADTGKTLDQGVAFVSEDRRGVGLMLDESIELNIVIAAMKTKNSFLKKICGINLYDKKAAAAYADQMIRDLDIRCTSRKQPVKSLSGGNQQKVCIARALTLNPRILFVSEPTRGIDIGAKKMILDTLLQLNREKGVTIVVTSSELAELRSVCNRIAIITDGKVAGILKPYDDDYKFGLLMSGMDLSEAQKEGEGISK